MNTLTRASRPLAAALLLLPLAVSAQESRYWSVQAGIDKLSRWPATVGIGGPTVDAELALKRGPQFGLAWGKQNERARYELEVQHGRFAIEHASVAGIGNAVDAKGSYDVLTANALRQFPLTPSWSLYAGLGIGAGRAKLPHITLASGCKCMAGASKSGFAWQAKTGAEVRLSESRLAFLQLGWLSVPGPEASTMRYPRRGFAVLGLGLRGQY